MTAQTFVFRPEFCRTGRDDGDLPLHPASKGEIAPREPRTERTLVRPVLSNGDELDGERRTILLAVRSSIRRCAFLGKSPPFWRAEEPGCLSHDG